MIHACYVESRHLTQSVQVNKLLMVLATFLTPPLAWQRSESSKKFMVKHSRPISINYIKSIRWLKLGIIFDLNYRFQRRYVIYFFILILSKAC